MSKQGLRRSQLYGIPKPTRGGGGNRLERDYKVIVWPLLRTHVSTGVIKGPA